MNDYTPVNILRQRSSGILLPIFSLPGDGGIGEIGSEAFSFLDFLGKAGQSCWQILPLGPTSPVFGNSPYMSPSAFAGSPLLISTQKLVEEGLLQSHEVPPADFSPYQVLYPQVMAQKQLVLELAWSRFQKRSDSKEQLQVFLAAHRWAEAYGLFLALKEHFNQQPWYVWPSDLRRFQAAACREAQKQLQSRVEFHLFVQMVFFKQWQALHAYAQEKGIRLIGDLPIYVALDSVDVWSNQAIFQLDAHSGLPTYVAGVPPDYFSKQGQMWGNPLYRWQAADGAVEQQLDNWWQRRLQHNFNMVDVLRIDHFRGFEAYWSVPASEKTAVNGQWQPGPGRRFFTKMQQQLGEQPIIAEDLGIITPEVEQLRSGLGYPGMKVLLFAFDGDPANSYLPYNIDKNSVLYTGTHDNDTAVGWYLSPEVDAQAKRRAKRFANRDDDHAGSFHSDLLHLAFSSPANLTILPMQDVLGFGNDCRMNTPGTTTGNWQWRCAGRFITDELANWLAEQTRFFGRIPPSSPTSDDPLIAPQDIDISTQL